MSGLLLGATPFSARVAQLVEHTIENCGVGGSSPPPATKSVKASSLEMMPFSLLSWLTKQVF